MWGFMKFLLALFLVIHSFSYAQNECEYCEIYNSNFSLNEYGEPVLYYAGRLYLILDMVEVDGY